VFPRLSGDLDLRRGDGERDLEGDH
jgi:hypothetical protein